MAPSIKAQEPPHEDDTRTTVRLEIDHLRDKRGVIRLCLIARADHFPDCRPSDHQATIKARRERIEYAFKGVRPGVYAIAAFHDADGNGRLNKMLGIPLEGFAFSQNPRLRPRAPRFDEVSFSSLGSPVQRLQMRYLP